MKIVYDSAIIYILHAANIDTNFLWYGYLVHVITRAKALGTRSYSLTYKYSLKCGMQDIPD